MTKSIAFLPYLFSPEELQVESVYAMRGPAIRRLSKRQDDASDPLDWSSNVTYVRRLMLGLLGEETRASKILAHDLLFEQAFPLVQVLLMPGRG